MDGPHLQPLQIIIIAFCYSHDQRLTSIFQDLYLASLQWQEECLDIIILSDLDVDDSTTIESLASFPNGMQIENLLRMHQRPIINDLVGLEQALALAFEQSCRARQNLVVYYTGHGDQQMLILPNQERLAVSQLFLLLDKFFVARTEALFLLDCCGLANCRLPYSLQKGRLAFVGQMEDCLYLSYNLLLITACRQQTESFATRRGSLFTRYMLEILQKYRQIKVGPKGEYPSSASPDLTYVASQVENRIFRHIPWQASIIGIYASRAGPSTLFPWLITKSGSRIKLQARQTIFSFK